MIRIIAGTYGYKDRNGILQPKTAASKPFSVAPDEEKRLIRLGVAEKVDAPEEIEKEASPSVSRTRSRPTSRKSS